MGIVRCLAPRESHYAPSREGEPLITTPVTLESRARAVCPMPVGLNDQPCRPPDEVDLERSAWSIDPTVHLGLGDASHPAEAQEALLELAACEGPARIQGAEDRTNDGSATTPGRAREKVIDRTCVQDSKHLCLIERALHRTAAYDLGEVEVRAPDRGAWHAMHLCHVLGPQVSRPVAVNPSARAF